jgi:hypothetical protein
MKIRYTQTAESCAATKSSDGRVMEESFVEIDDTAGTVRSYGKWSGLAPIDVDCALPAPTVQSLVSAFDVAPNFIREVLEN